MSSVNNEYVTAIPPSAFERITERHPIGGKKSAEYVLNNEVVGVRHFFEDGHLKLESFYQHGKKQGTEYTWSELGKLSLAEPYVNGLPHGLAKQWSSDGQLLGTYTMVQGTGIDLWREQNQDGSVYLAEVLYMKNGQPHGFQWWINADQCSVFIERHWRNGLKHGIERAWDILGTLDKDYPKFFLNDQEVSLHQYIEASTQDPTLPAFREADNQPVREFPIEIAKELSASPLKIY